MQSVRGRFGNDREICSSTCSRSSSSSSRSSTSSSSAVVVIVIVGQMRCRILWLFFLAALLASTDAAKGGGGRSGARRTGGRVYKSRMPILIPHRNPASANYYENKDGARIVKASHFELDYMLGRKITFFCMATGIPRPEITWLKDGIELYHHKFFQVHEWPVGNDTLKSKMEIDPATQKDAGYYECQADNQYAVDRRGFRTDYVMISY